jgi:hypothetical protein
VTEFLQWPPSYHMDCYGLILPSPSAQILTLCHKKDIFINRPNQTTLKLKITTYYNNFIISPDISILPSMARPRRIGSKRTYFILMHLHRSLLSIFRPLIASIQRMQSRGDCDRPVISLIPPASAENLFPI